MAVLYENIYVAQSCVSNYSSYINGLVYAICELRRTFLDHNGPHNASVKRFADEHPHDAMTRKYNIKMGLVVRTPGVSSTMPWFGSGDRPFVAPASVVHIDLSATPQTPPGPGPPPVGLPPGPVVVLAVVLRFAGYDAVPINPGPGCMPNPDGNWNPQGSAPLFPPNGTLLTKVDTCMNVMQTVIAAVRDMDARLAIVQAG